MMLKKVLCIFPERLRNCIEASFSSFSDIYEIRLICDVSLFFYTARGIRFIDESGNITLAPTEKTVRPSGISAFSDPFLGIMHFLKPNLTTSDRR